MAGEFCGRRPSQNPFVFIVRSWWGGLQSYRVLNSGVRSKSLDVFASSYCGASIKVATSGGTVALELPAGQLASVRRDTEKTAAELALRRLTEELTVLRREMDGLPKERTALADIDDREGKFAVQIETTMKRIADAKLVADSRNIAIGT